MEEKDAAPQGKARLKLPTTGKSLLRSRARFAYFELAACRDLASQYVIESHPPPSSQLGAADLPQYPY